MDTPGNRLKLAREAAKLTQKALGELANTDQPAICRYETGKVEPPLAVWASLAGALGVSLAWVLTGEGRTPRGIRVPEASGEAA